MNPSSLLDVRILIPVLFSALYSLAWAVTAWRNIRISHFIWKALDDSTPSLAEVERSPGVDGFLATLEPAPEPFQALEVRYRPASALNPLLLLPSLRTGAETMVIRGQFAAAPVATLTWTQAQPAGLRRTIIRDPRYWQVRYFDVFNTHYAVQGADTEAIENVFRSMQARFGPLLQSIHVLRPSTGESPFPTSPWAREEDDFVMVLHTARMAIYETPPLMAAVRSLARAALL